MADLDTLIAALDTAHWELEEAFSGMPDGDVWVRAHPRLWSVGELASHMAYGEDMNITGGTSGSLFLEQKARYYDSENWGEPLVLDMGAQAVYDEVQRVHGVVKEALASMELDPEGRNPHRPDWNWHQTLEYMAFHVAYHTGQIYSVRHMLGHVTVDN